MNIIGVTGNYSGSGMYFCQRYFSTKTQSFTIAGLSFTPKWAYIYGYNLPYVKSTSGLLSTIDVQIITMSFDRRLSTDTAVSNQAVDYWTYNSSYLDWSTESGSSSLLQGSFGSNSVTFSGYKSTSRANEVFLGEYLIWISDTIYDKYT